MQPLPIQYLAAARRAELDYLSRSAAREAVETDTWMRGRYRRQAAQHARKAANLAQQIVALCDAGEVA